MQIRRSNNTLIFSLDPVGPLRGVDVSRIELATEEEAEKKLEEISGALEQEALDLQDEMVVSVGDLTELTDQLHDVSSQLRGFATSWYNEVDPEKKT